MGNRQDFVSKPKSKAFRHGPPLARAFGRAKKAREEYRRLIAMLAITVRDG